MAISYLLKIENKKEKYIEIGSLGRLKFKKGIYVYVGSAKRNLIPRIKRHLRKEKKYFWHIDYFLKEKQVRVKKVWQTNWEECRLAGFLSQYAEVIEKFGSSDCKCRGHLFYVNSQNLSSFLKKIKADEVQV